MSQKCTHLWTCQAFENESEFPAKAVNAYIGVHLGTFRTEIAGAERNHHREHRDHRGFTEKDSYFFSVSISVFSVSSVVFFLAVYSVDR